MTRLVRFAAALCALIAAASYACAEDMSVIEALDIMLTDNIALRSMRQEAEKAQAKYDASRMLLAPEVSVTAGADVQRKPQTSDGSDRSDSRSVSATIRQPLWTGGRVAALRRQASSLVNEVGLKVIDAENASAGELFARFFNVLLQAEKIEAERSAVATSEAHLREIEHMNSLGLSNRLEVIRASGALATNRAMLVAAESAHSTAVISLMNYLAIPPGSKRGVRGELRALPVDGTREESLAAALERRADIKAISEREKFQQAQIEVAKSGMRPKLELGATAGWLDPYDGRDRSGSTWRAELTLTIPVFDRMASRTEVRDARAALEQERIAMEGAEIDVRSDIETAWTEIERTFELMESTSQALELATESLRLAEVGFQEGVTPQLDLLSAQTSLTEARLTHLSSLYAHMIAVASLRVTEGRMIEWIGEAGF